MTKAYDAAKAAVYAAFKKYEETNKDEDLAEAQIAEAQMAALPPTPELDASERLACLKVARDIGLLSEADYQHLAVRKSQ